ncbi:thaumatin, pathogenesis-related protein [Rhodotorula toruloides]|uniref:Thaumatin, pathogenesis-related protein n=1 Tax=Rhodotorula toruloides TaxID=5286 RepID=A0A511KMY4_RHOTO|nr:thaumatin, pathogenesis-related protein [Rhodotorula toruloides]
MLSPTLSLTVLALASGIVSADRTFTIKNNCKYTIWPALFTSAGTAPFYPTGWEAKQGTKVSFKVAEDWNGRIWARTSCKFDGSTLPSTTAASRAAVTEASNARASAALASLPPPSGEWNLAASNEDWYDVSAVDGTNIPMSITNDAGCAQPSCKKDINKVCPTELSVYDSSHSTVLGCLASCQLRALTPDPSNSPNCCSGAFNTPQTCPKQNVQYYEVFKSNCPDAYAYAYDESSGSALWTCPKAKKANYTLTFCP